MGRRNNSRSQKRKRPIPLAPPPKMTSRKKARTVTTLFHKYSRERDLARQKGDMEQVQRYDKLIADMGGREEYQRASQLSTSFHSTSKWVLGSLARNGWLYGIPLPIKPTTDDKANTNNKNSTQKKRKKNRRNTRLLEVGAINTELIQASLLQSDGFTTTTTTTATSNGTTAIIEKQQQDNNSDSNDDGKIMKKDDTGQNNKSTSMMKSTTRTLKYKLDVRAIDIHSMDERIEEIDFLTLPFINDDPSERFDVIVCSMVINCVTTPIQRGKMLARLYHHLRPGGLCFLTLPKFCLTKSAFLTPKLFHELLSSTGVGFNVEETKETPKVSFFVCRRPEEQGRTERLDKKWTKEVIRNKGKKFPNQFSVVLEGGEVFGRCEI